MINHRIVQSSVLLSLLVMTATVERALAQVSDANDDRRAAPQFLAADPAEGHGGCTILKTEAQRLGVHNTLFWLDNTIYYAFDAGVSASNQTAALNAMALIEGVSFVTFVERTTEPDYILIQSSTGNNSFIGRIGGPQALNIFNWGTPYIIVHELMHAMGMYHEQSRADRDTYVQINDANICQTCCSGGPCDGNFDIEAGATIVGPYDFDSVMHYGQCTFSACPSCFSNPGACAPITVLPPNDTVWQNQIGQMDHFSDGDILTMQTMYPPLSVPCEDSYGDLDGDLDSDLADVAIFQTCYGANTGGRAECSCADKNVDEMIDTQDVADFMAAIRGPNVALGACCGDGDGVCTEGSLADCSALGGTYQGDGSICAAATCPIDNPGACCDPTDLSCEQTSATLCAASGGIYKGNGTSCNSGTCPAEYVNTASGNTFYPPGAANVTVGDDLTLAGTARNLAYYDLTTYGQSATPYAVTVSLYDACPGSGGTLIAGTTRTFNGLASFQQQVLRATFDPVIALPDSVYMVMTTDSAQAYWVLGFEAETGSTDTTFGQDNAPWNCNFSFTGGTWGGFRARIVCVD